MRCFRCWGTRYEPSAATTSRQPCLACQGLGWLPRARVLWWPW